MASIKSDDEETPLLHPTTSKVSQKSGVLPEISDSEPELDPDVLELPQVVRESVPLEDDPTIPVLTFRYFVLSTIFIIPGAFIDTMNSYRTTSAAYSIFFVQIVSYALGKWLATTIPHNKHIHLFGYSINLNPGKFSAKELAAITITNASGATGNLATNAISLAELHFGEVMHPLLAIGFMFSIVFIGYSYAIIAKNFVLYDPHFTWPKALMQTTLLQSQARSESLKTGSQRMRVFYIALIGMAVWQLFPELFFPLTSSLAVLCWMAPHNETVNFIGSGMGGMGFLNFSLDWANITSSIMIYPYWIQVIQFVGFVVGAWILLPLAKWGNVIEFKAGLMSNRLFLANGLYYPTDELLTADLTLNLTAYEYYGPVHLGAQRAWNMFFDYAAYVSGIVWVGLFGYDRLKASSSRIWRFSREKGSNFQSQYTDRLNVLHSQYKEVPAFWYLVMFSMSVTILIIIWYFDQLYIPWWCCVIALLMGSIIVTPLIWLYALSNFQLPIGTFNELLYGYMVEGLESKHGAGAAFFGSLAGNAWYRSQHHLESMKLGFYNHVPPRDVFFAQIYGELIGIPVNYVALKWVMLTKREYLDGSKLDPLRQWTGQSITTYHTNAVQYVILGPTRLFANYPLLPYGFVLGLAAPLLLFTLHKRFPNSFLSFHLWNTTVLFSTMSTFYGNLSTGYLSKFIGGTVTMFYAFRFKHSLWKKYNYILAAAFDTGYNLAILVIFVAYAYGFRMPNWWGNDKNSVELCFAL